MLFLTPAPDAVRASSLRAGDKFVISLIEVIAVPIPEFHSFKPGFTGLSVISTITPVYYLRGFPSLNF